MKFLNIILQSLCSIFFAVIRTTPDIEDSYKILKEYVDHVLEKSSYQNINLSQIFESIHPKTGVVNYK